MKHLIDLLRQARAFARANDGRTQWALMKVFRIKNADGSPYLTRLRFVQCPYFGVFLHRVTTADPQPDLHDHPYPFVAIPLLGGYTESYTDHPKAMDIGPAAAGLVVERRHNLLHWNVMPLSAAHRIVELTRVPTWTLVFVGPRVQTFGFWTESGYVPFDQYSDKAYESGDESRMLYPRPDER